MSSPAVLPCKRGHVAARTAKRECIECKRLASAVRAKSSQKRASDANYREQNREQRNAWFRSNYASKRPAIRERQRAYAAKTSARNVRRAAEWHALHPESKRTAVRNRRARLAGSSDKHTRSDVLQLLIEQGSCCAACRADLSITGYHVDHAIPISRGGSNGKANLQLLCPTCNLRKGALTMDEFRNWRSENS